MHIHPEIAGEIAHWTLQDTYADASTNTGSLTIDVAGTGAFADMGDIRGYRFRDAHADTNSRLIAPNSAALRFPGDFTIELLIVPLSLTLNPQILMQVAHHIGSKFVVWYLGNALQQYGDDNCGLQTFSVNASQVGFPQHWTLRKSGSTVRLFRNGVVNGVAITSGPLTAWAGNEQLRIGDGLQALGSDVIMASIRILNYARSDADIAADAAYTLDIVVTPPAPVAPVFPPSNGPILQAESDLDPLGAGIVRPFRRTEHQDFASTSGVPLVLSCLEQVLGTPLGSLPWEPFFGSNLYRLRHRSQDPSFLDLVRVYSSDAVKRWEPRAIVLSAEREASSSSQSSSVGLIVTVQIGNRTFKAKTRV